MPSVASFAPSSGAWCRLFPSRLTAALLQSRPLLYRKRENMGPIIFYYFLLELYVGPTIFIFFQIKLLRKRHVNATSDGDLVKGAMSAKTRDNTAKGPSLHWFCNLGMCCIWFCGSTTIFCNSVTRRGTFGILFLYQSPKF